MYLKDEKKCERYFPKHQIKLLEKKTVLHEMNNALDGIKGLLKIIEDRLVNLKI